MMARIAHSELGPIVASAMAAALAVGGAPARAQCRLCDTPTTKPDARAAEGAVNLEIEAGLDFDRLIVLGPGEGSATLRPDGSSQVSGVIGSIGGRAMVGEARVRGEPGRAVRIDLPSRIELHSSAGRRVAISDIVTDLPSLPRLDSAGSLNFRFGGRIEISGEAEGDRGRHQARQGAGAARRRLRRGGRRRLLEPRSQALVAAPRRAVPS